jgi:cysteinyl-tRNA synthetase
MVELIQRLVKAGVAYQTADGVYFQSEKVEGYGLLARQSLESLRAGARVEVDEEKRSPLDFVLWKKAKEGEPSWPSPWGQGRPGWHTECVVMALDLLGEGFDIHGGGMDLAFPHHENERAQALADGKVFAHHWVHNGFVELQGEKMSKSLGNIWSLTDLLAEHDGRAYRLLVLRAHYRSPVEITPATIADAEAALERLDAFARRTAGMDGDPDHEVMASFRAAMDDDLDTPKVVALLFAQVKRANAALDDGEDPGPATGAVREITAAIGLPLRTDTRVLSGDVAELVRQRDEARTNKDFDAADRIRETLTKMGYVVEDSAAGTQVRRRD